MDCGDKCHAPERQAGAPVAGPKAQSVLCGTARPRNGACLHARCPGFRGGVRATTAGTGHIKTAAQGWSNPKARHGQPRRIAAQTSNFVSKEEH